MSGADFSSSNYYNVEVGTTKHSTKWSLCTNGSRGELDRQAQRIATLTVASCARLLLLLLLLLLLPPPLLRLLLFCFLKIMNPNVTTWSRVHTTAYVDVRSCWFVTIQDNPCAPKVMHRRYDCCKYYRGRASLPPFTSTPISSRHRSPQCSTPRNYYELGKNKRASPHERTHCTAQHSNTFSTTPVSYAFSSARPTCRRGRRCAKFFPVPVCSTIQRCQEACQVKGGGAECSTLKPSSLASVEACRRKVFAACRGVKVLSPDMFGADACRGVDRERTYHTVLCKAGVGRPRSKRSNRC